MSHDDLISLLLTFKLALVSTFFLLIISIPLAWWLATSKKKIRFIVESIVSLPIILPPTILGFYLLITFSPTSFIARYFDFSLAFSFSGLVVGSVLYSLPFVIQPIKNSFLLIGEQPIEVASTLGASRIDAFFSIVLPMSKNGVLTGAILGFAHTIGEFGVVLMIGGAIPGKTKVVSIAIFEHVEALEYSNAHILSLCILAISFILLYSLSYISSLSSFASLSKTKTKIDQTNSSEGQRK